MEETLEKKVESSNKEPENQEKKTEKKGIFRKSIDLTYLIGSAIGTSLLSSTFIGPTGMIIGGALAGGGLIGSVIKKGKTTYENITEFLKTYSSFNLIIAPYIALGNLTFPIIGEYGAKVAGKVGAIAAKTAYALTAYHLVYVTKIKAAYHMIKNYLNPKGIIKSIKENYWPMAIRKGIGLSPAYALVANGVESIFGIPTFAYNALPMGLYNSMKPIK